MSCYVLLLAVSSGKGRKEDSTYDWPCRNDLLFRPHDYFPVIKGECSLSEEKGGEGRRRGYVDSLGRQ